MNRYAIFGLLLATPALVCAQTGLAPWESDPIVVTADFHRGELDELAGSISLIDDETLEQREAAHLDQVLNLAPNVNISTGASRGRFFQIRGVGTRSQFVEPMNASVGLLVDGIDLTGLGGAASTLDIDQIEILRGPQGTLFGANAMAGLINMVSADPTEIVHSRLQASVGDYGLRSASAVLSGPISDHAGFRIAWSGLRSDGYQKSAWLDRDDVQNLDEQTARLKLGWQPHPDLEIDLTGLFVEVDNGYDAYSLDNTRITHSDQPGHDRQDVLAASARLRWLAHRAFNLEALISRTEADSEYGYDEDWTFDGFCEQFNCLSSPYSSFDNYIRGTHNTTLDLRAVSASPDRTLNWVVGAYSRDQFEDLQREYTYMDDDFRFAYDTENRAVYGQLGVPLGERVQLITGLRREWRDSRYRDSHGAAFSPDESMWGGKLALEYRSTRGHLWYALASRGYKAGGVNADSLIPDDLREFDTETLWNYELGAKIRLFGNRLNLRTALFYQDRDRIQTEQSLVVPVTDDDSCPCQFIDYKTNATAGISYGLETELDWRINERVRAFANLGLLKTEYRGFLNYSHSDADPETGMAVDMDGRELPHAPSYMFALGAIFQLSDHWYLRLEAEGKDGFNFSSRHEARSNAYELFHARLGWRGQRWDVALWARNLGDKDIRTRGFGGFGNDPRKGYAVEPYYQFGEPRVVGITASYAL